MKLFPYLLFLLVALSCSKESRRRTDGSAGPLPKKDTATFTWATELCDCQSTYSPDRYTKAQLRATHALWLDNWYLEAPAVAATPDELPNLRTDKLRQDYEQMRTHLQNLTPVDVSFWQQLKQRRLQAMEAEYALKRLAIRAHAHPELLRQSRYDSVGAVYVDALISGDTTALLTAWQRLHEEQKKNSGLPKQLDEEFTRKFNAANRLQLARVELMAYGWWYHTKPAVPYVEGDERMEAAFKALFTAHKTTRSEPNPSR
ncbi:hypothetical protein ACFSUS_16440 [Spirosoma soli]|uniref:Uncharacterized protein n=1 Tax=Spirosoma soli TaxID=1770529 RepID=A0ABW5M5G0_9BACT